MGVAASARAVLKQDTSGNHGQVAGDLPLPQRFPRVPDPQHPLVQRLRRMMTCTPHASPAQWASLGAQLWRGDPLADEAALCMHDWGTARAWSALSNCWQSSAAVGARAGLPLPLRTYLDAMEAPASWHDPGQAKRGARVLQSCAGHALMVLRDAGLMAGYQASAINQTLLATGALQRGAAARLAQTTQWWLACTQDQACTSGSAGLAMTARVRLTHALVRSELLRSGHWAASKWGLPINQLDMQATYLAFSVVQLLGLRMTGVWLRDDDAQAVMHLWRHIGWLMGVSEELLARDEAHGRACLYLNLQAQQPADESSVSLARALMDTPALRPRAWGASWRGHLERESHLSLVRWFIGPQGMQALGLPPRLPWYALLVWLPHLATSVTLRLSPSLRQPWRRWARRQQLLHAG